MNILDRDRKHVWHPYASMTAPPPVNPAVSASGTRIRLADGSTLIDSVSSWWCAVHGHNHPKIVEAVQKQAETLCQVMFAGFTHEPAVRLAELLAGMLPSGLDKIFFVDSGSVAVECAIKMALQYQQAAGRPERNRLGTIRGGYHGDTMGAMAVSDSGGMHRMFEGVLARHHFAPRPEIAFGDEWNDADFAPMAAMLDEYDHEIAAVIVEPIFQGANGMRFYHPQYLRHLAAACRERDMLLIFDEVATGFGRLGKLFAREFAGVTPDLVCVGKGLTGGAVGLAALAASGRVAETVSNGKPGVFVHGPTFMANPIACAAGCASLELFGEYDWRARAAEIEQGLRKGLEPLRGTPGVQGVRVLGAVGVVELAQLPSPETVQRVVRESGVWLRPFGSWLYAMPPLVTPPGEVAAITAAMRTLTADSRPDSSRGAR